MGTRRYGSYNNGFYHSKAWKSLRLQALRRDHYTCQECLKKGKITPATTVHHIKPIRTLKGKEKALKLENLETVCAACHNRLHKERGKTLKNKKKLLWAEDDENVYKFSLNKEL